MKTRKHYSRVRTTRLLTLSRSIPYISRMQNHPDADPRVMGTVMHARKPTSTPNRIHTHVKTLPCPKPRLRAVKNTIISKTIPISVLLYVTTHLQD